MRDPHAKQISVPIRSDAPQFGHRVVGMALSNGSPLSARRRQPP